MNPRTWHINSTSESHFEDFQKNWKTLGSQAWQCMLANPSSPGRAKRTRGSRQPSTAQEIQGQPELPQKKKVLSKLLLRFKLQLPWLISNDSYKETLSNVCKGLSLTPQLWRPSRQTITYRKKLRLSAPGPESSGWLLRFSQSRSWNEMGRLVTVRSDSLPTSFPFPGRLAPGPQVACQSPSTRPHQISNTETIQF